MPETCPHFPNGLSPLERAGKLWRDLEEHRDPTERGAVEWADLRPIERRFYVSCVSELIFHNDLFRPACVNLPTTMVKTGSPSWQKSWNCTAA